MAANILPTYLLPTPLDLGFELKVKIQLIENMVMLHMKLNRVTKAATCKYFGRRSPLPDSVVKCQLVQNMAVLHIKLKGITNAAAMWQIFYPQTPHGHVAYQIKGNGA